MFQRTKILNHPAYKQFKRHHGFFTPFLSNRKSHLEEHEAYKRQTSRDTRTCLLPPVRTKMLVRDFINDSLYNPNYGFFAKQPISFNNKEKEWEGDEDYIRLMSTIARTHGGVQSPHSYSSTELFQVGLY